MTLSKNEQEFIAATEHAVAVAKRANAKEPTVGFCYKFQPDLWAWHNKIDKRFERLRVKDVNQPRTNRGEYLPLKLNRINIIRSESWEHSQIEEAAVEAFLKDNGDAANYLMP